jgi:hypothetical protein
VRIFQALYADRPALYTIVQRFTLTAQRFTLIAPCGRMPVAGRFQVKYPAAGGLELSWGAPI